MQSEANRYVVEAGYWGDEPVMILRDGSQAQAMVAPNLGSNCVFWAITHHNQELQVLETPASPNVLRERASRGGVPVLWPFPGRVRDAQYQYQGKTYHLPPTDKSGVHHIHGLVLGAKWEIGEYGSSAEGAYLTTHISSDQISAAIREAGYPFKFALSLRFTLKEQRLSYLIILENKEQASSLPFSFGLHPYFRVPLVPTGSPLDYNARVNCEVQLPVSKHWPTEGGLASGPAQATPPAKDFSVWKALGGPNFDDMYSGVVAGADGFSVAAYRSPALGLETQIKADANFQNWVFFSPPERASLAIEPYTSPPDAINLATRNVTGNNLLELAPGATWQAQVIFEVI
jgi:aldose 1-epimerase